MIFSDKELYRYSRHFILPEIGIEGQKKLKDAKVLVVGAGGLGAPVLLYLAAAGVGTLGIVDDDVVEESNLQRQVLFDTETLGKPKALAAADRISKLNPYIKALPQTLRLTSHNALDILAPYDIIIDGTDNFPTRYLVNDACVLLDKVNVYGSIFRFEGQVSVFNNLGENSERGPNYRDLFPEPPPPGMVPSCAEGGVLGVLPGIVGSMQANEAIKIITGTGDLLDGKLLLVDAASMDTRKINIRKTGGREKIQGLIDYEQFCNSTGVETPLKEIGAVELKALMESGKPFMLYDIREPWEHDLVNIGGKNTSIDGLLEDLKEISENDMAVVYCRSGKRSEQAIREALTKTAHEKIFNLRGGLLAWIEEVDATLKKY